MNCPIGGKPCHKFKGFEIVEKHGDDKKSYSVCEDCLYLSMTSGSFMPDSPKCYSCGALLDEVIRTSRFGCAKCYDSFSEVIPYVLDMVQFGSNLKHEGRPPESWRRRMAEETEPEKFASEVRNRIIKMIDEERYEEAARLKGELAKFEEIADRLNEPGEDSSSLKKSVADFIFEFREGSAEGL